MSIAPAFVPDRQPSPRLNVPLASNNPFRNRTSSSGLLTTPTLTTSTRPVSTNPFLDESESLALQAAGAGNNMSPTKSVKQGPDVADHAAHLFDNLSLDNKPRDRRPPPPPKSENIPTGRPSTGREQMRAPRRPSKEDTFTRRPNQQPLIDIFADPQDSSSSSRRPPPQQRRERRRRNSESSIMERPKVLDPEEERRRRERRHRERDGKSKDKSHHHHSRRNNSYKLDIIDKLDVTSVYGGVFHHDGPFDACNPHRNRKNLRNAPMQAFPKDSSNMALGGTGPNRSNIDLNQFHGRGEEGYADFSSSAATTGTGSGYRKAEQVPFNPTARVEPIHGAESMGLGTSTFLEGAPASRAAMQRRQSENEDAFASGGNGGGLQRKKSLAQKIRGINNRGGGGGGGEPLIRSPAANSGSGGNGRNEKNPFFQDYDDAYDAKGVRIREVAAEDRLDGGKGREGLVRPRSVSSPKVMAGLGQDKDKGQDKDRDRKGNEGETKSGGIGGGLMSRMKSLRRPRPDRRVTGGDGQ